MLTETEYIKGFFILPDALHLWTVNWGDYISLTKEKAQFSFFYMDISYLYYSIFSVKVYWSNWDKYLNFDQI